MLLNRNEIHDKIIPNNLISLTAVHQLLLHSSPEHQWFRESPRRPAVLRSVGLERGSAWWVQQLDPGLLVGDSGLNALWFFHSLASSSPIYGCYYKSEMGRMSGGASALTQLPSCTLPSPPEAIWLARMIRGKKDCLGQWWPPPPKICCISLLTPMRVLLPLVLHAILHNLKNLKCGKLWRNTSHSICMFRRCHGEEERGRKKKGTEQRNKMTFVWVQPRVCLCCFKRRESCACVGQNICSSGNIQRAVRVLPVHPVIISSPDHSRELQDPLLFDPPRFSFFLVLSPPATSTAVTHAAERHFEFGCMQNVHIKLHKLLPFFFLHSLSLSLSLFWCRLCEISFSPIFFFFFRVSLCPPHFYPCVTGLKRPAWGMTSVAHFRGLRE